ncbi:MAG: conserved repeat domain, partial [Propionibacteriaceae bacterium]|nr:conserved repeat domain [Propionibacteriaceae bacterium]
MLDIEGEVVASTVSSPSGHYVFDNLQAGRYSVRFAGVPEEFRLTPASAGGQRGTDSDPDYSGVTPPFTLGVGEPNVRPTTATDGVVAEYINSTIDAGITPLRYAVGDRVWLDVNSDGVQQPDEPAAPATVSLLTVAGNVVATTNTDATGHYQFTQLRGGRYRLQFTNLPAHHALTGRAAGTDPALDSDPDPATGLTPVFVLAQGAPNLVPAAEVNASSIDFENRTLNAGVVTRQTAAFTLGNDSPADPSVDAGLTSPANYSPAAASSGTPVDAARSPATGIAGQIAILVLALAVA